MVGALLLKMEFVKWIKTIYNFRNREFSLYGNDQNWNFTAVTKLHTGTLHPKQYQQREKIIMNDEKDPKTK